MVEIRIRCNDPCRSRGIGHCRSRPVYLGQPKSAELVVVRIAQLDSNAVAGSGMFFNSQGASISKADVNSLLGEWPEFGVTATTHTGATFNEVTGVQVKANTGEFGELDHPTKYSVLHGAPQAFEGGQVQVGSTTI
jgi:hypothetical protein